MQVSAIADNIREYTQQETGIKPFGYDGYQNSQWIRFGLRKYLCSRFSS